MAAGKDRASAGGLVGLEPIDPRASGRFADAVGRHQNVVLRLSESVVRPLPRDLPTLRRILDAVFLPLAASDPAAVGKGPRLQWLPDDPKGWEISIADTEAEYWRRGSFAIGKPSGREKDLAGAVRAQRELRDGLELIEADWLAHRLALWVSMRTAEQTANQLMGMHLLQSHERVEQAAADYVGTQELIDDTTRDPGEIITSIGRARRSRFDGLVAALGALRDLRLELELDTLQRQRSVLGTAAVAAALVPVTVAAGLSADAPAAIEDLAVLARDAGDRATAALFAYFRLMRRLAAEHPILVVLHHVSARPVSLNSAQRDTIAAVGEVRAARDKLYEAMVTPVIPQSGRAGEAPTVDAMIEAIAEASVLSVWKLPLFADRALEQLPDDERQAIRALREVALDRKKQRLLVREMVLTTVELASMAIPPARAVGFVLSLAAGLARLTGAVRQYDEMTTLYHASMDPGFLALGGEEHQPADADMILFDIAAMVFDVHGLGRAARGL